MKYTLTLALLVTFVHSNLLAQVPTVATDVSPLLVSEVVPSTMVNNINGEQLDIKTVLQSKPSIMLFYRGGWCPYCNVHLSEVGKVEKDILSMGFQVIAISPDNPENLNKSVDKNEIAYKLYSDGNGSLMKAMGIAFQAPERYENRLMEASSDQNVDRILPVPSVFVVDQAGVILFEYISPDYKQRMSSAMLLDVLQHLIVD